MQTPPFSVYGTIISQKIQFVNSFLKLFFFFRKKPIDKTIFMCYNNASKFQFWISEDKL